MATQEMVSLTEKGLLIAVIGRLLSSHEECKCDACNVARKTVDTLMESGAPLVNIR